MHHSVANLAVGTSLDSSDQHIIGLRPSAVFNPNIQAIRGQIQAITGNRGVLAFSKLNIVVSGVGGPHIQEADGIVVICHPAITGDGVIAVLAGVQECVPLLVLQIHGDPHRCQRALQIFPNGLMIVGRVIQIGQNRKVGEHARGFIVVIVLAQNIHRLGEVIFVVLVSHAVVTGKL